MEDRLADEKTTLLQSLQLHRDLVRWKVEGLDDERLRRPMTPTGTNLLGMVKHLAAVEYGWFRLAFGRDAEPLPEVDDDPEADMRVEAQETTDDVLAFYARACAAADSTIYELDLDDTGRSHHGPVSLRWVLVHMVEETARHVGHMDILRELLDGATGYRREDG